MSSNLLDYLASAASVRAEELARLQNLPATLLDDTGSTDLEDRIINIALADADGFLRATSFTITVRSTRSNSRRSSTSIKP